MRLITLDWLAGLSLVAVAIWTAWLLRRAAQRVEDAGLAIRPPVYRFTGSDEALAVRTRKRREAADAIRVRAAKVETGAKVSDVLKLVKK